MSMEWKPGGVEMCSYMQAGCTAGGEFIRIESCPEAVVGGLRIPDGVKLLCRTTAA